MYKVVKWCLTQSKCSLLWLLWVCFPGRLWGLWQVPWALFYSCLCPRCLPLSLAQRRAQKMFVELHCSQLIILCLVQWGGILGVAPMGALQLRSALWELPLLGYTRGNSPANSGGRYVTSSVRRCSLRSCPYLEPIISNGLRELVPLNFTEREGKAL